MKNNLIIAALLCVVVYSVAAGDKIDVSAVVTKADAEAILGVPVKDPKGRNKEGSDGFYDSEWSYYAVKGDKALVFDVLYAGREAPPHLTQTMFSVLGPERGKPTPDRKSTRLNSSHSQISYAVFCLKKKQFSGGRRKRVHVEWIKCCG